MISDTFKNTIWIYYETNLKARTRKEYWNVVKNFDKVVGHDPLELSHTDAVTYYEHILNKISKNQLKYSTGVMRLSVIRSVCNFIEFNMSNHVYKKDHVGTNHTLMILIQSALTMPNTL
jgi:site-specific recombinase XerD